MCSSSKRKNPKKNLKKNNILSSIINASVLFATTMGLSFEQIINKTGINPITLMNPEERISDQSFLKLLRLLEKAQPTINVSLALVNTLPLTILGKPWQLLSQATDVSTFIHLSTHYYDLISDQLEITVIDVDNDLLLKMHHVYDDIDGGLGAEMGIGLSMRAISEHFGKQVVKRVQFRHSPRSPLTEYNAHFGVPVSFNADCNAIVHHHDQLGTPNKKDVTIMPLVLEQNLKQLRQEYGLGEIDDLDDVRAAIKRNIQQGDYTALGLAKTMAMSLRNLQRRLRASGTNATTLFNDIRYANSLKLLANQQLSIAEIAFQQGFDSERGFRKAFERWSTKTPTQARRELLKR